MITAADTGQLIVYVTDDPIDDAAVASVMDMITGEDKPVLIDASQARNCFELEQIIGRQRLSKDLGTRSHFMASLCASADRVHFLRRM